MFNPWRPSLFRRGFAVACFILLLSAPTAIPPGGPACAAPAAAAAKPLTVIFFGCQEGYLKPCG
jgi:hypothetical protein